MLQYTEWCPYCGAETDYNEEWTHIKCKGCGRWLMPCDWCYAGLHKGSPAGLLPCGEECPEGFCCPIEADERFKRKRKRSIQKNKKEK